MTPKKPTETIEEYCKANGYNSEDISLIVYTFWDEVVRMQRDMGADELEIPGLGTTFMKIWTIKRKIASLDKEIQRLSPRSPIIWKTTRQQERDRLEQIKLLLEGAFDKKMKKKVQAFDKKRAKTGKRYDPETKTVHSLEEQKPDS